MLRYLLTCTVRTRVCIVMCAHITCSQYHIKVMGQYIRIYLLDMCTNSEGYMYMYVSVGKQINTKISSGIKGNVRVHTGICRRS